MKKNKTILVTGSTGGIGSVLCDHLAEKGYDLILTGRTEKKLSDLAAALTKKHSVSVKYSPSDFNDPRSFENLLKLTATGINGLIMMPPQMPPTEQCLPEDSIWEKLFKQSFIGPTALIRELLPALKKGARSKVVIISGISSAQVLSHYATSNVLRTAWLGQAKTLAHAYGPDSIHFNTLSLGGVMTKRYTEKIKKIAEEEHTTFEEQMNEEVSNVPLRKYAEPVEVAKAVEGLLSEFTDHMTGTNFICDGGFTRAY
jgi:3-oxoacyl-[acyl-carrier protein] reductase